MAVKRLWAGSDPRCLKCGSINTIRREIGTVEEYGVRDGKLYALNLVDGSIRYPENAYIGDYLFLVEYRCLDCGYNERDSLTYFEKH